MQQTLGVQGGGAAAFTSRSKNHTGSQGQEQDSPEGGRRHAGSNDVSAEGASDYDAQSLQVLTGERYSGSSIVAIKPQHDRSRQPNSDIAALSHRRKSRTNEQEQAITAVVPTIKENKSAKKTMKNGGNTNSGYLKTEESGNGDIYPMQFDE